MNAILHAMGKVKAGPLEIGKSEVHVCKYEDKQPRQKRTKKQIEEMMLYELSCGEVSAGMLSDILSMARDSVKPMLESLIKKGVVVSVMVKAVNGRPERRYKLAA